MRISELIAELEAIRADQGNLLVALSFDGEAYDVFAANLRFTEARPGLQYPSPAYVALTDRAYNVYEEKEFLALEGRGGMIS